MTTERITKGPEENREHGGQAFAAVLRDCVSCGLLLAGPNGSVTILNHEAEDVLRLSAHGTYPLLSLPEALRTVILKSLEKRAPAQVSMVLETSSGEAVQVGLWAAPVPAP